MCRRRRRKGSDRAFDIEGAERKLRQAMFSLGYLEQVSRDMVLRSATRRTQSPWSSVSVRA